MAYGWGEFVISRKLPLLKFIKRPIIIISPPYRSSDIHTINPKFQHLSEKFREEIRKFWSVGRPYDTSHDQEIDKDFHELNDVLIRDLIQVMTNSEDGNITTETKAERRQRLFNLWSKMEDERMTNYFEEYHN
mgnify:CR=1 FL=1